MAPNIAHRKAAVVTESGEKFCLKGAEKKTFITEQTLKEHNGVNGSPSWIAIKNKVYDVTGFGREHPGGSIIFTHAGLDATDVFNAFHPASVYKWLSRFYVGELVRDPCSDPSDAKKEMEYRRDITEMKSELLKARAFQSSKLYYAFKVLSNAAILAAAVAAIKVLNGMTGAVIGGVLLALFWQQCGWLAHDFLHHQVFTNRFYNNLAGLGVGNIWQGFSTSWWKMKHNHHHASPNVVHTQAGGDPDILTIPLLLWSEKIIEGDSEDLKDLPRFLIRHQKFFYLPLLAAARLSWLLQSLLFQLEPVHQFVGGLPMKIAEIVTIGMHYVAVVYITLLLQTAASRIVFLLVCQSLGGLFIAVVFTVGHNAMHIFTTEEMKNTDFVRLQVRSTRDITPTVFNMWFSGGLAYQVEHHIWPTLPRHSLPLASKILQRFCSKYNIPYTVEGLVKGNLAVCKLLSDVGKEF